MQAVILAGGKGTRLKSLTGGGAKSMVLVDGKPFLEYEINLLRRKSVSDFLICIGFGGKAIQEYFGDGEALGVRINYSDDGDQLLGTAGSIKKAQALLSDRFFITYGDAYPIIDLDVAWKSFSQSGKLSLMVVHRNFDRNGKSNTVVNRGLVTFYSKKDKSRSMEYIEFGVTFMRKEVLGFIKEEYPVDLEPLYRKIISMKEMAAFEVDQRIYDIGSPEGLAEFRRLVASGKASLS